MKYHYMSGDNGYFRYGKVYRCNHPMYDACTLYLKDGKGLAVIQKRFNTKMKVMWWGPINRGLVDAIYFEERFPEYFRTHAGPPDENGLYPTVTIREIMWGVRMKPLEKEFWENGK